MSTCTHTPRCIPADAPVTLSLHYSHRGAFNPAYYTVRVKSLRKAIDQVARIKQRFPFANIFISRTMTSKA